MRLQMRNCLILIELLLFVLPGYADGFSQDEYSVRDSVVSREYNLLMEIRGREVTGICMMNQDPLGHIVGTMVNEFGIKAFDFTYADGKAKVFNVIGPLDKWYIRKVLRDDFSFILANFEQGRDVVQKKRKMSVTPSGDMIVDDNKYRIRYTFTSMQGNHETD